MGIIEIENKLRELFLPVFGLDTIEEVQPQHSLVDDLGAESLDFVEIMYVIESEFGVILKTNEIIMGGYEATEESLFTDGKLNMAGVTLIKQQFPDSADKIKVGLSKVAMFSLITVRDMAKIIHFKIAKSTTN